MLDLAFIEKCADPGIEIAIVERFIAAVGTDNPLAISITSGNRVILPEPPATPADAMRLIERFVGQAVVRVGVTRYPAGHGIADASELDMAMLDACENIRMGTALFGKVFRIVAHSHGAAGSTAFTDAVTAWGTGTFEGRYVFSEVDPVSLPLPAGADNPDNQTSSAEHPDDLAGPRLEDVPPVSEPAGEDPNEAGIRVDLSDLNRED